MKNHAHSKPLSGRRIKTAMPIPADCHTPSPLRRLLSPRTWRRASVTMPTTAHLFAEAPPSLARLSAEPENLLTAAHVAARMRQHGLIDSISKASRYYHDVPALLSFRAHSDKHPNNGAGFGQDFFSEEAALWRALGEAQERSIWRFVDFYSEQSTHASYADLSTTARCINPRSLVGFAEPLKAEYPSLHYTEHTPLQWTKITSFTNGKTYYCPSQLLSYQYAQTNCCPWNSASRPVDREPILRWCITTGLGTGQTPRQAFLAGIYEVIERDALMSTYLNQISAPQIDLNHMRAHDTELDNILSYFDRYNLTIRVVKLATDFPGHALCSIITDETSAGPSLALASNAAADVRTALLGAVRENLSVYMMARSSKTDSTIAATDRSTLHRTGRVKYWATQDSIDELAFLYQNTVYERPDITEPPPSETEQIRRLKAACLENQQPAYFLDLTKAAGLRTGIHSVSVVMPEMHPLHLNEELPYFDTRRVHSVAKKCGYEPLEPLNTVPHPFP